MLPTTGGILLFGTDRLHHFPAYSANPGKSTWHASQDKGFG